MNYATARTGERESKLSKSISDKTAGFLLLFCNFFLVTRKKLIFLFSHTKPMENTIHHVHRYLSAVKLTVFSDIVCSLRHLVEVCHSLEHVKFCLIHIIIPLSETASIVKFCHKLREDFLCRTYLLYNAVSDDSDFVRNLHDSLLMGDDYHTLLANL